MAIRRILSYVWVLLVFSLMISCAKKEDTTPGEESSASADERALKLGYVTNLSVGGATEQGLATRNGFELAIKEINAAGGINGEQIQVVVYDDEAKPEKAVEHVTRLINSDEVLAVCGFVNSGNALASQHITQEAGVPMLVNFGTATDITLRFTNEPKNYIFRYSLLDSEQVERMLDFVENGNFSKVGVLHDTSGYGTNGMKDVVAKMEERGMDAPLLESLNTNDTDMTTQLQRFKQSGVDVVILYGLSPENANSVRSAQKIDYSPAFIGSWNISFGTFRRLAGELRDGVYMTTSYVVGQTDKSLELNEKMIAEYGEDVLPIASAFGYDSAYLLVEAIKKAGKDPEAIRDALENLTLFDGAVARIQNPFSKTDHEALSVDQIFTAVWQDGEIAIVE